MIKGIHHISYKCNKEEEIEKVKEFYVKVLGMPIIREWAEGFMFDTGNGLIEVFTNGENTGELGVIRHVAFATDNVDEIIDKVKAAGYEVFMEPVDKVIRSTPELPIRVAFCYGPLHEEVEFFCERG